MTELIKLSTDKTRQPAVSGRDLHEFLEVNEKYTQWFDRMVDYGFKEGTDFQSFSEISEKPQVGRPSTDHAISLDMAKQIAMIQRTERGKQARQYFIECERQLKAVQAPQTYEQQVAIGLVAAQRLLDQKETIIAAQRQQIEADKPKVDFADAVAESDTTISVAELAKIICQNGVKIGRDRLFVWLRENGFLCKQPKNKPTQRSIEAGWFKIHEKLFMNNGRNVLYNSPRVTGKGQIYFVNRFLHDLAAKKCQAATERQAACKTERKTEQRTTNAKKHNFPQLCRNISTAILKRRPRELSAPGNMGLPNQETKEIPCDKQNALF